MLSASHQVQMPRFRFELDPLLRKREREERDAQLALAELNAQSQAIMDSIRASQQTIAGFKRDWRGAASPGRVDLRTIGRQATAALAQQVRAQQAARSLASLRPAIDAARERLLDATTRRRAVELLRERRLRDHLRDLAQREIAEHDDLASARFAHD